MSKSLTIEGKKFLPSTALAGRFSYTSDYLAKLAREGRVTSTRVGRQWFIEEESLQKFAATIHEQKSLRRHELRLERVAERLKNQKPQNGVLASSPKNVKKVEVKLVSLPSSMVAISQTFAVLVCGLFVGVLGFFVHSENLSLQELSAAATSLPEKGISITHFANDDLRSRGQVASADFSVWWDWLLGVDEIETNNAVTNTEKVEVTEKLPTSSNQGVLVLDRETSTTTLNEIKKSFSDEVQVTFDDENSGVITPVFNRVSDESYRFLLVPVNDTTTP